jgi:plasmid maintenance system antidote protein VapI
MSSSRPRGESAKKPTEVPSGARPYKALGDLLQSGLDRTRLRAAAAARLIEVEASQMSRTLAGQRLFSPDKLTELADILGISREEVLRAAGKTDTVDIDLSNAIPTRTTSKKLTVVTDGAFVDSSLFLWIFGKQPFRSMGVECVVKPEAWENVPERIATYPLAIGFFNKEMPRAPELRLRHWADLCLYKGYALICRTRDASGISAASPKADDARVVLRKMRERAVAAGRKPSILTMGDDPADRLRMAMPEELNDFKFKKEFTADQALNLFREGEGDGFLGGLPQRLRLLEEGAYIEVVHFDNNPFLFSVNSIFATQAVFEHHRNLLHAASALWFETVRRLRGSSEFRARVAAEIVSTLDQSEEGHSLRAEFFEKVFGPRGDRYEVFSTRPGDLVRPLLETAERIAETGKRVDYAALFGYMKTVAAPNAAVDPVAGPAHASR